jgi:hypothetical protein
MNELKMSEKSMIREVKYRLERILNKNRAGSIFTQSEEIAIEWILKDLLGQDTSDIERRLIVARNYVDLKRELTVLTHSTDGKENSSSVKRVKSEDEQIRNR